MKKSLLSGLLLSLLCVSAHAKIVVPIQAVNRASSPNPLILGTITLEDTQYGLLITPALRGLSPGMHGFHVHQVDSCADNGNAAGGHLDESSTHAHKGPYDNTGHLGDLPALFVDTLGVANLPIEAPRLSEKTVQDHALIIHAGADNYSDTPLKLGGGGARVACGMIPHNP